MEEIDYVKVLADVRSCIDAECHKIEAVMTVEENRPLSPQAIETCLRDILMVLKQKRQEIDKAIKP